MKKKRNNLTLLFVVLAVAGPMAIMMLAYEITKNPALRPLARTENDVAIHNGAIIANKVIANIRWTTKRQKNFSQQDLEHIIRRAFKARGVRVFISFDEVNSNDNVTITYQVGVNKIGPTRIANAADSIREAITVYRMYQLAKPNN